MAGIQHLITCPSGSVLSSLGCGTSQCCVPSTGVCIPNLYGPCVCVSGSGAAGSGESGNLTFVGSCGVGGAIMGVPNITSCANHRSEEERDMCYCRFTIAGQDVGVIGDMLPGNWIFGSGGECLVFNKEQPGAVETVSGGVRIYGEGRLGVLGLMLLLVVQSLF